MIRFSGGWEICYKLISGKTLELIREEDGYMEELKITIMPYDGLKSIPVERVEGILWFYGITPKGLAIDTSLVAGRKLQYNA
jgi:hypothetical protein